VSSPLLSHTPPPTHTGEEQVVKVEPHIEEFDSI
jgi:hypothetical protein